LKVYKVPTRHRLHGHARNSGAIRSVLGAIRAANEHFSRGGPKLQLVLGPFFDLGIEFTNKSSLDMATRPFLGMSSANASKTIYYTHAYDDLSRAVKRAKLLLTAKNSKCKSETRRGRPKGSKDSKPRKRKICGPTDCHVADLILVHSPKMVLTDLSPDSSSSDLNVVSRNLLSLRSQSTLDTSSPKLVCASPVSISDFHVSSTQHSRSSIYFLLD
jgi:hypothetical protein